MPPLGSSTRTGVRRHNSIATGASLVTCPGANPVPFVCSGIPLCARHSTSVPDQQPVADIRDRCSSMSSLCWHHDTTGAVDLSAYARRPRLSSGCSAGMEQTHATRDLGLLFIFDILKGDQGSAFSSVIRLTALSIQTIRRPLHSTVQQF